MIDRNFRYCFLTLKDFKVFYSHFFSTSFVNKKIKQFRNEFKEREDKCSSKLQFIKKCEWEFNRIIKNEEKQI